MALTLSDLKKINDLLGRKPTEVETMIFDTMWSEHCSYKSSKRILKRLPTKGSEVVLGIGEDAGIIHLTHVNGTRYCIAVSHESHNHPSQILPIEGAATGVGGCVRDVYCMGADVFGVLNSLHFGVDNRHSLVDEIADKVVYGISDYGNPLGVPVLGGETLYHSSYNENCLVNVAAIGLLEESDIIHSYTPKRAKDEPYDVILVGKSTDATGFGGASFSSASLDTEDEGTNLGAVQVHDPFLKRVLVEAIKVLVKDVKTNNIEIGFKDLGAGGISCATSEIASASGFGIYVNLDLVNVSVQNLPPEVIACSETQERFCLVVPKHYSHRVLEIFNSKFELPKLYPHSGAVIIGEILQEKIFKMSSKGDVVCELPVDAITTEVTAERTSASRSIIKDPDCDINITTKELEEICTTLLSHKNNASKRYVYRFFDNAVRGDTIIYPGEADAVLVAPVSQSNVGVAVSMDSNLYGNYDPYVSGAYATAESIRNVVAVGARPIALTDCLNYGNPEKSQVFFDFEEGVNGIRDAAEALNPKENEPVPIISGNVSFYNESKSGSAVVPSPVLMCIGKIEDYHKAVTMQLKYSGRKLLLIGERYKEFAGTHISQELNLSAKCAPQVRFNEESINNKALLKLIDNEWIEASHDISLGGLFSCVSEMILGERGRVHCGVSLRLSSKHSIGTWLFSENGGFVISINPDFYNRIAAYLSEQNINWFDIGETTDSEALSIYHNEQELISFNIKNMVKSWAHHCD
jgi:phosphoribosylformylglycinamidine synthase II